jgi:hypothetical protein
MPTLQLGKIHLDRQGNEVLITRALTASDRGYARGFRFEGTQENKGNGISSIVRLYSSTGATIPEIVSTPEDLVHVLNGIPFHEIEPGMMIGDMHGHEVGKGRFSDWEVNVSFEIEKETFQGMYEKLPVDKPFSGKQGYIVSATEDVRGNASALLIIYNYDSEYRIAHLIAPEWKTLI